MGPIVHHLSRLPSFPYLDSVISYYSSSSVYTLPSHTSNSLDCVHLAKLQRSQIQLHLLHCISSCLLGSPLSAQKNVGPRRAGTVSSLSSLSQHQSGVPWRHVSECACLLHGFLSEIGEGSESSFMVRLPWRPRW